MCRGLWTARVRRRCLCRLRRDGVAALPSRVALPRDTTPDGVFLFVTALRVCPKQSAPLWSLLAAHPASHGELNVNACLSLPCPFKIYPRSEPAHNGMAVPASPTSHAVAIRNGCTKPPNSSGQAQGRRDHSLRRHFKPCGVEVRLPWISRV